MKISRLVKLLEQLKSLESDERTLRPARRCSRTWQKTQGWRQMRRRGTLSYQMWGRARMNSALGAVYLRLQACPTAADWQFVGILANQRALGRSRV